MTQDNANREGGDDSLPKFTPGPWEWDAGIIPPDGPGRYSDIYVEGGDKIIAQFNEFREFSPEEGVANAHLIATSPELYAALLEARDQIVRWMMECDVPADIANANIERVDGVLAKARGERP